MILYERMEQTMYIKASAAIRNNYNEISQLCKETGEPVYLTKNGEGDLVVMDIRAFEKQRRMLEIETELLGIHARRLAGTEEYISIEEMDKMLAKAIDEAVRASAL